MAKVITVDFEGVESGGGKSHVPEGDYGVKLSKVAVKTGESSGQPYLKCSFKLIKGERTGPEISHNFSLQKQSLWNFRNFLEATGKQVASKAVKIDPDKLIGLECAATLVDAEYEGRKHSEIAAFFPLTDLAPTKSSPDKKKGKKSEEETEEPASDETETEDTTEEEEELFS